MAQSNHLALEEKQSIQQQLLAYAASYGSQNKAANSLQGITSPGTFNSIINGKFDRISDDMFLRIRAAITQGGADGWNVCKTAAFNDMYTFLDDAQKYHNVSWIVAPAGSGKTTAANMYAKQNRNVFVISCSEDMHKPDFVEELARKIGIRNEGLTIRRTFARVVDEVVKMDHPLLVFDEGDKLKDNVLQYFITIYNELEDKCGMVFLSTPAIDRRFAKGLRLGRMGYEELYSRFGRRFVPLTPVTGYEVNAICRGNGLKDDRTISLVLQESGSVMKEDHVEFDLRRAKKSVRKHLSIAAGARL